MTLGWRLVPGQAMHYAFTTTHRRPGEERGRREHWSYLVRDLDDEGVLYLEGRLTGFGAGIVEGPPVDEAALRAAEAAERERLSAQVLGLELSMDGRLRVHRGDWGDTLPHRLLGLRLPVEPVAPGDEWSDPAAARPFADLLPVGVDLEVAATNRLEGIYDVDGRPAARISTRGAVRPTRRDLDSGIWVQGESWWDLQSGWLIERTLTLRMLDMPADGPGELALRAERVE